VVAGQYNGSLTPVLMGYIILGIGALSLVLITEKGRLFRDSSEHS